jgi:hypothetical protein
LGKAALFAGRCRKQGLGRSVVSRGYPPAGEARRRQRVSGGRRGGERRRACAHQAHAPAHARGIVACAWQARPSLGPSTRARLSSLDARRQKRFVVRRSIRYHGWASPREWEEPALGPDETGAARLAACHRFREEEAWQRQKRKEVEASVPARATSPGLVARTSCFSCRSRQATPGLEYARHTRSKKSGQGRVNGGLARSDGRRVTPSAGASSEIDVARRTPPVHWGRIGAGPRVARERHPAVTTSPKSGAVVAGPGL